MGITCGQTSHKNLQESLDRVVAIRYSTHMNHNTYYSDSTICHTCGKNLTLDEEGYWCDENELSGCSPKPIWKNTRLIGWDIKKHSPVIEVK